MKGKIAYMSPEQVQRHDVDRRSDIFSLGIVFYELVTGEPCFTAPSFMELLEAVSQGDCIPPAQINPDIPVQVCDVLGRMLAADPDDRFQDADQLHTALQTVLEQIGQPTASDLARFIDTLFENSQAEDTVRVLEPIVDDLVPVWGELADPTVVADEATYRRMLDEYGRIEKSQSRRSKKRRKNPHGTHSKRRSQMEWRPPAKTDPDPMVFDPTIVDFNWNDTTPGTKTMVRPRPLSSRLTTSTFPSRQRRFWPRTLLWLGMVLVLASGVLVLVYQSQVAGLSVDRSPMDELARRVKSLQVGLPYLDDRSPEPRADTDSQPLADEAAGYGTLVLDSQPSTDVFAHGRSLGRTPLLYRFAPGTLMLDLRNQRGGIKRVRVTIPESGSVSRRFTLGQGILEFAMKPGVDVYIGNWKAGTTPMQPLPLYEGSYTLRLVGSEPNEEHSHQVSVEAGETQTLSYNFE
ncbi:MAG: PEGA domain-containing protein [Myxococcota bacterium]